ncbi:dehydrogenase/reductase SDR family member 12 isoform X1 [Mobula birostris]|uniref:dehydrogenase/reductase SDR family member 12 isoform X1 n=1 Tax=Mobula birostris TaxID=1983395 RepID=UPI003B2891D8
MTYYRNCVWLLKGLREYTRSGYEAAARHFDAKDLDVDVTGRCFLITGANSGIGKAAALEIAKRGGTVHLVCRNKERAEEAKAEIVNASNNEEVFVHVLDLLKPTMIWTFANEFQQIHGKLNVLINNAGCMINERQVTADQLESNFATNTLGAYILTTALIPLLQKSEDARVITVSSGGMLVQKLNVEDLQFEEGQFDGTMSYAQNKRQQVIMIEQWAKMYKNIHFSSMHPGWADTPAVRTSMPSFHARMKDRLRTATQGADTLVWLAVSNSASQQPNGLFFQDRNPVSTHLFLAQTRATAEEEHKLMKILEELAEKFKPGTSNNASPE